MSLASHPLPLLVRAGYRKRATYRLATLAGILANSTFGLIRAYVLLAALAAAGGTLAGYDEKSMLAYVWFGQAMLGIVQLFSRTDVAERIRSGDIAVDLSRPLDLQLAALADDYGRAAYNVLPRALPTLLIGVLVTGVTLPTSPWPYLLGLPAVVAAVAVAFLWLWDLGLLGFWVVETRGLGTVYMVVCNFFAGLYVPVALMPGWLETLARCTPFPSMLQTPIDLLSGRVVGPDALGLIAAQVAWALAGAAVGRLLLHLGHHRLVVQGG